MINIVLTKYYVMYQWSYICDFLTTTSVNKKPILFDIERHLDDNFMLSCMLLMCYKNISNGSLPCFHCTKVSSTYLNHIFGFLLLVFKAFFSNHSMKMLANTGANGSLRLQFRCSITFNHGTSQWYTRNYRKKNNWLEEKSHKLLELCIQSAIFSYQNTIYEKHMWWRWGHD